MHAGVDAINLNNSRRNILANLQTNEDVLDELNSNHESGDDSSQDDVSTKKYEMVEDFKNSSDIRTDLIVHSNEESSIESNSISPKVFSASSNKRKITETVAEHFLSEYKRYYLILINVYCVMLEQI